MRVALVFVALTALAGCASTPAPDAASTPTTVPSEEAPAATPTAADLPPETQFWQRLVDDSGALDPASKDALVEEARTVCEVLGRDDLLMDGSVNYWAGWSDEDEATASVFWQAAVDTMCPESAEAWQTVRDLKQTLNP